jgi:hypothetical protein
MPVALHEPVDEGAETARDVPVRQIDDVQRVRPRRESRQYWHQLAARNGRLGQEGEGETTLEFTGCGATVLR